MFYSPITIKHINIKIKPPPRPKPKKLPPKTPNKKPDNYSDYRDKLNLSKWKIPRGF